MQIQRGPMVAGADGQGRLASEISMPSVVSGDKLVIAYGFTGPAFYPGMRVAYWNADNNTLIYDNVLVQGTVTPSKIDGCVGAGRWVDFIDALTPIPNSSQVVLGGNVASPSPIDSTCATYWAIYTP